MPWSSVRRRNGPSLRRKRQPGSSKSGSSKIFFKEKLSSPAGSIKKDFLLSELLSSLSYHLLDVLHRLLSLYIFLYLSISTSIPFYMIYKRQNSFDKIFPLFDVMSRTWAGTCPFWGRGHFRYTFFFLSSKALEIWA